MSSKFLLLSLLIGAFWFPAVGRVFLVGSNPNLTILAFPQDIFKFPTDNAFFYTTYENKPWWGDIDDPPNKPVNESPNRPNNTYLATGENVSMPGNNSSFSYNEYINAIQNMAGLQYSFNNNIKTRYDLRYSLWGMHNNASGSVAGREFSYKEKNSFHEGYFNFILGVKAGEIPCGLKIGLGGVYESKPDLESSGLIDSPNRLVWGWSTLQGQNVVGNGNEIAHAEYQDQYSIGPLYEVDIQPGITFPKLHLGGRFRYHFGDLNTYNWRAASNQYLHDQSDKLRNITGRLYGNYIWAEREKYRVATLVLTRYTHVDTAQRSVESSAVQNGVVRTNKNFVLQINPNISIYPWKSRQTYIDAAILCNYSYMRYAYTGPRWVSGGMKDSYMNSNVNYGDESWWEKCSYSNQNFFEVALDLYPVFPIFGNKDQSVALGVSMMLWTRFKWTNKYYGNNDNSGTFNVANIRKNYDHESWLNSMFNLIYRRGPFVYRLDIGQPLIYSLTPQTRVTDASGKTVLYEKKLENMWVSQSGVKVGFFVTTSLENLHAIREELFPGLRDSVPR